MSRSRNCLLLYCFLAAASILPSSHALTKKTIRDDAKRSDPLRKTIIHKKGMMDDILKSFNEDLKQDDRLHVSRDVPPRKSSRRAAAIVEKMKKIKIDTDPSREPLRKHLLEKKHKIEGKIVLGDLKQDLLRSAEAIPQRTSRRTSAIEKKLKKSTRVKDQKNSSGFEPLRKKILEKKLRIRGAEKSTNEALKQDRLNGSRAVPRKASRRAAAIVERTKKSKVQQVIDFEPLRKKLLLKKPKSGTIGKSPQIALRQDRLRARSFNQRTSRRLFSRRSLNWYRYERKSKFLVAMFASSPEEERLLEVTSTVNRAYAKNRGYDAVVSVGREHMDVLEMARSRSYERVLMLDPDVLMYNLNFDMVDGVRNASAPVIMPFIDGAWDEGFSLWNLKSNLSGKKHRGLCLRKLAKKGLVEKLSLAGDEEDGDAIDFLYGRGSVMSSHDARKNIIDQRVTRLQMARDSVCHRYPHAVCDGLQREEKHTEDEQES